MEKTRLSRYTEQMNYDIFESMISLDHLFTCWHEFKRGKRRQKAVQQFERFLEDNIFRLREDLASFLYKHGPYEQFRVCDPKERLISKASVRDRLVHHILIGIENCTFANAKDGRFASDPPRL